MVLLFDLANISVLLDPAAPRYLVPFSFERRQQHRLAEEQLPDPDNVEFVYQEDCSEVSRSVVTRLKQLWRASGKLVVGQAEKDDTNRIKIGRLLHTFDRIYTVDGLGLERFVCFQCVDRDTYVLLRHFADDDAEHKKYTGFLNLLEGRWYRMKRDANINWN